MSFTKKSKSSAGVVKSLAGHESDHSDDCSPFCHCSCCAGFAYAHHPAEIVPVVPNHATVYPIYRTAHIINISSAIWQPPQLA